MRKRGNFPDECTVGKYTAQNNPRNHLSGRVEHGVVSFLLDLEVVGKVQSTRFCPPRKGSSGVWGMKVKSHCQARLIRRCP